jgi:Family of unknown function (DUF6527)
VKLTDLNPQWTQAGYGGTTRGRAGLWFDCPGACCATSLGKQRIHVPFRNPGDGGPDIPGDPRWQRTGDTFETMSLTPSVDASKFGHWHGFISGGEVR